MVVLGTSEQYQPTWTSYRSTSGRLERAKALFTVQAGVYATAPRPEAVLAEPLDDLVSEQHAAPGSQRQKTAQESWEVE